MDEGKLLRFCIWDTGAVLYGQGRLSTAIHAHNAEQWTLADGVGTELRAGGQSPWRPYQLARVAPRQSHAFRSGVGQAWSIVFTAQVFGASLTQRRPRTNGIEPVEDYTLRLASSKTLRRLHASTTDYEAIKIGQSFVECISRRYAVPIATDDPRVQTVLEAIDMSVTADSLTLGAVAKKVFLSPSRLRHLLRAKTGGGFRAQVRWRRLLRAWQLARSGATLSQAAFGAGFTDGAHLSRSVRELFGLPPSAVLSREEA